VATLIAGIPVIGIIFSYTQIFTSILKILSVRGRYKAFSICGSHLAVVSLFYDMAFVVYMISAVIDSSTKNVVSSVMYIVLPQMLNHFIYSLRNREIKRALRYIIIGIPFL
jgi:olfactory receptor